MKSSNWQATVTIRLNLLSKPGMWVQNMTTKEPDDSMIEVAICAVEKVFDWREWQEKNNEL